LITETRWRSADAFREFVGRREEAASGELIVFHSWDSWMPAGSVEAGLPERMPGQRQPGARPVSYPGPALRLDPVPGTR
jgi:hypothetical protein